MFTSEVRHTCTVWSMVSLLYSGRFMRERSTVAIKSLRKQSVVCTGIVQFECYGNALGLQAAPLLVRLRVACMRVHENSCCTAPIGVAPAHPQK